MNIEATGPQSAPNLPVGPFRIENVLHHVLGNNDIKAFVCKCLVFDILAAEFVVNRAKCHAWEKVSGDIARAFSQQTQGYASEHRRGFMNARLPPKRIFSLENVHSRSFARDRATFA